MATSATRIVARHPREITPFLCARAAPDLATLYVTGLKAPPTVVLNHVPLAKLATVDIEGRTAYVVLLPEGSN